MTCPRRLTLALILLAAIGSAQAAALPQDTAATVNGVPVTRKALLDVVQAVIAQLDEIPDTPTTEKYRRQALESLVDFELLYQEGQARNLAVSNDEVAAEIKKTQKGFPNLKAYQDALASKGLTQKDIEQETRRALVVNRVLQDVVWPGVSAHDDDIRRYYDQHRSDFDHPAQIRASYILIRAGKAPAERKAAREKAAALAQRARSGESFAALARAASEDPASAPNGGDLGYIAKGTMGDAFDQVAFALPPGGISDVVEASFGFAIVLVVGKRDAGTSSVEEVHDRIAAILKEEGRDKAQEKFVAELRSRAKIEVAPDLR